MKNKIIGGVVASLALTSAVTFTPSDEVNVEDLLVKNDDKNINNIANEKKVVLDEDLNLRESAEIKEGNILFTMRKGSEIEVLSSLDSEWVKVKCGNKEGYALSEYINNRFVNAKTANDTYTVTATSLNVRSGAGTKYSVLGTLKKGQNITVTSVSNGWAKFTYKNRTAYASTSYLKKVSSNTSNSTSSNNNSSSSTTNTNQGKVTATSLNVRAGAGTKYSVLGTLSKNSTVEILGTSGDWYKIKYKNSYGYVSSKYITKTSANNNSTNNTTNNNASSNNSSNNNTNNSNTGNTGSTVDTNASNNSSTIQSFKNEVLRLVNKERAKEGLCSLTMDSKLSTVAQIKAQEMVDYNYFAHQSPISGTPFELMKSHGITYKVAGENLAKAYSSPEEVVKAWMNSSGHRKNIMNSRFTHLGVGISKTSSGVYYWTQMFTGQK